ncbi:hypothetical protein MTO96_012523 [Rhipicephalus appendiculatus]
MELIFVYVTFVFFLDNDRVDLAQVKKLNLSVLDSVWSRQVDMDVELNNTHVVYGPSNEMTDTLINKLLEISDTSQHARISVSYDEPDKEPVRKRK